MNVPDLILIAFVKNNQKFYMFQHLQCFNYKYNLCKQYGSHQLEAIQKGFIATSFIIFFGRK